MNGSTPGLPVHHQLPEFTQTHVHRVSDAIQPSPPLSSPSPPAPNPSQHQSLFQWATTIVKTKMFLSPALPPHQIPSCWFFIVIPPSTPGSHWYVISFPGYLFNYSCYCLNGHALKLPFLPLVCFFPLVLWILAQVQILIIIMLRVFACSVVSTSLQLLGLQPAGLFYPWNFPGKKTGAGCHFLFQGLFLTQGLDPRLLRVFHIGRWILNHWSDVVAPGERGQPHMCFSALPRLTPHSRVYAQFFP